MIQEERWFVDRFKSEPVNDMAYFVTLLRYIHQNPTKAGMVSKVGDYDWSSWKEYTGEVPGALGLCATNAVLKLIHQNTLTLNAALERGLKAEGRRKKK